MQSVNLADPVNHAHFEDTIPIPREDSIVLTVSTVDGYLKKAPSTATPVVSPQSLFVLSRGNGEPWRGSTPDGKHSLYSRQFVYSVPIAVRGFKKEDEKEDEILFSVKQRQDIDQSNRPEETGQEEKENNDSNHQNTFNMADSEEKEEVGKDNNLVQLSTIDNRVYHSSEKDVELLSLKNQFPVLKLLDPPSELGIEFATNAFRFCIIVMVVILFIWIKQCYA